MRQQEKPVRFCLYSRKSKATLKGDSIGNQIEMGMRYIRDRYPDASPEDIDIFEDDGFSGKNTKRPGFTRMMAGVTRGDYAYLIVYRPDKLPLLVCMAVMAARELARDKEGAVTNRM